MAIRPVSALAALLVTQGVATSVVAEEFEQHGAHEHGHAELTVAQSGKSLTIALESPAMNLVGFEHEARTAEQKAAVQAMLAKLRQGYQMITLDEDALCLLDTVDIRQSLLADGSHDEHKGHDDDHDEHKGHDDDDHDEHKGHDDHDHDEHKGHDDHGHDEHKGHDDHDHDEHKGHDDHDHKGHDHGASGHSDVDVTWQFTCMQPAELKNVKLGLFSAFPLLEELDVQWTGPAGQGAKELNSQHTEFKF